MSVSLVAEDIEEAVLMARYMSTYGAYPLYRGDHISMPPHSTPLSTSDAETASESAEAPAAAGCQPSGREAAECLFRHSSGELPFLQPRVRVVSFDLTAARPLPGLQEDERFPFSSSPPRSRRRSSISGISSLLREEVLTPS